jgi:hypothetical protein
MHFAYDGFTHLEDRRCFMFRGIDELQPMRVFTLEVDMALLAENQVPMQEGPMLCLQLLKTASAAGPIVLERYHNRRIFAEDLRPFLVERAKTAAEKAMKRLQHRTAYRKPPSTSNITLGAPAKEN